MKNQDYLDRNLRELLKSAEPQLHMPADRKAEVLDQLLQEAEMSTGYEHTRVPWIKLGVAATVLLAIALGICLTGKPGVAFADVLENIQQRGYAFTYWVTQEDGELKRMGQGIVLQPGLIRWDMPEDQSKGLALVTDAINHKMRWVTTAGKNLGDTELPQEVRDEPNFFDSTQNFMLGPVEELWGLVDGTEESLGKATKNGVNVIGYRVEKAFEIRNQKGTVIYTIWANVSTAMPHEVTMEVSDPNGRDVGVSTVLREFDFDAEIHESLFGPGPAPAPQDFDEDLYVVQPGVGMGELLLGADQARIEEILGPPDFIMGEELYQYSGLAVSAREGKVYSLQCGDANGPGTRHYEQCPCRTAEGIGMGSSEQDVVAAYGEPTRRVIRRGDVTIAYRSKGMGFLLREDKVYVMSFSTPRQSRSAGDD